MHRPQRYVWHGNSYTGNKKRGTIYAHSRLLAKLYLYQRNIRVRTIYPAHTLFINQNTIKSAYITEFTQQLALLLEAGIPLIQAFTLLANSQTNPQLHTLLTTIKNTIETGTSLTEALQQQRHFNPLFCCLTHAGEQSGSLPTMLTHIVHYRKRMEQLRHTTKKALSYPLTVFAIAILVIVGLLLFVVPQLEHFFHTLGGKLPTITQITIQLAHSVQHYWLITVLASMVSVGIILFTHKNSPLFRARCDQLLLHLPTVGTIFLKIALARFSRTLAITYTAGVPIIDALSISAGSTNNQRITQQIQQAQSDVLAGKSLQQALHAFFPTMLVQMIAIGEQSGRLEYMLNHIASVYELEVQQQIDALTSKLEPTIMIIISALIGLFIAAMYLPIFKLGSMI